MCKLHARSGKQKLFMKQKHNEMKLSSTKTTGLIYLILSNVKIHAYMRELLFYKT